MADVQAAGRAKVRLYHNPGCSKSRGAHEILCDRGIALEVVEYLETPPTRTELESILDGLEGAPADLVRRDRRFESLGLDPAAYVDAPAVVALLLEHPELMQRPVVVAGGRTIIARPPELLLSLLD